MACFDRGCVHMDERCHNDLIQSSPYDSGTGKLYQKLSWLILICLSVHLSAFLQLLQ